MSLRNALLRKSGEFWKLAMCALALSAVLACDIFEDDPSQTPTPEVISTNILTPTPTTESPGAGDRPKERTIEPPAQPTATPHPTATPEPTATTESTATPEPTATTEPTSTPEPTATTEPTSTPESGATPSPSGNSLLSDAVVSSNYLAVERLARVMDVDLECPSGELPLYLAIIGDSFLIIEALAEAGADVNATDADGNPLLYHAIVHPKGGYLDVKALIEAGADVNARDAEGNTLLSAAVAKDDLNVIDALIDADAGTEPTATPESGATPGPSGNSLCDAVVSSNYLVVERLARVTDVDLECPSGELPLYLAIIGDSFLIIEALAEAGADVNATDADGNPLLYHAIVHPRGGYLDVKALIRAGADVNATDAEGNTLLSAAVAKDDLNVIDALIDAGAGQDAICNAIAVGDIQRVRQLIGTGTDANADCSEGPILYTAIREREPEIVRFLVDAGADVNARNSSGDPLLGGAVISGEIEIARILVDAGADVNARSSRGDPLLYTAVTWSEIEGVRFLVDAGADVNARNDRGTSIVKAAFEEGESGLDFTEEEYEIFQFLLNAGAVADFPPPVPRIRVIDRSDSSLTILVTPSLGLETHYAVRRLDATESGKRADLEVRDTDGRFEDQGLNADSTYYYALQACNDYGCSEASDETAGLTESDGPVDAPSSPTLQGEKHVRSFAPDFATVTWDSVEGATYYELWYGSTRSSTFKLAFEVSAPIEAQSYVTPNNFSLGYSVTSWKVKACNKAGCSQFSEIVTIE